MQVLRGTLSSAPEEAKLAYVVAELSCGSTHAFARTHGGFLYGVPAQGSRIEPKPEFGSKTRSPQCRPRGWGCDSVGQLGFAGELSRDVSRGRSMLFRALAGEDGHLG